MPKGVYERPSAEERFWSKVNKETGKDCWEWTGALSEGYGLIGIDGKMIKAHRFSYELHKGRIPEGMVIMHSCDNPKCCNPNHLSLGTNADNIRDKVIKNRQHRPKGEINPKSKLNVEQVKEIKNKLNLSVSQRDIAKEYGVHQTLISSIKTGKTWSHLNI